MPPASFSPFSRITAAAAGWPVPAVLAVAFVSATALFLAHLVERDLDTRRAALARDLQTTAEAIHQHLQADRNYLLVVAEDIGGGIVDEAMAHERLSRYAADHPGVVAVALVDPSFVVRWVAPAAAGERLSGRHLETVETLRALTLARDTGEPVYSRPHRELRDEPGFEVYLPVPGAAAPGAYLVGFYSIVELLRETMHSVLLTHYAADIGVGDVPLAGLQDPARRLDGGLRAKAILHPIAQEATLRLSAYEDDSPHGLAVFGLLSLVLAASTGFATWGLYRHLARRRQAEAEAARAQALLISAIDGLPASVTLFDAEDRLVLANQEARRLFPHVSELLVPGARFQDLIDVSAHYGLIAGEPGAHEEQLARRLAVHRAPAGPFEQRYADGRWIEVRESRTADGGTIGIHTDITERKRAEEALRESEAKYRTVVESTSEGYWLIDIATTRTLEVNEALCRMLDHPRAEILDHSPLDFADAENRRLLQYHLDRLPTTDHQGFDAMFIGRDGREVHARVNATTLRDVSGQALRAFAFITDVTGRRLTERALRESEARFRRMADTAPVMIWMSGPDKKCTYFNRGWLEFTGRAMEQELGDGWAAGVHPDDLDRCLRIYIESFDAQREFRMEYRLRRYDGDYRWILDSGVPRFGDDGAFAGYIGCCIDIADAKQAEDDLRASEERQRAVLGASLDGIITLDDKGRIVEFNRAAETIFGYRAAAVVGLDAAELIVPPELRDRHRTMMRERLAGAVGRRIESEGMRADGTRFPVEVSVAAIPPAAPGEPNTFVAFVRDITERRRFEDELRTAKEQAEHASRAKSRFLAAASHDLRQPLQALNMFVSVLSARDHDAATRSVVDRIETSLGALEGLLNALLDISKLEAGLIVPQTADFPIAQLVERLREEFQPQAAAKGIAIRSVASSAVVHSDPTLIERILRNLIANACRYTERGKVLIGCRRRQGRLALEVWDTGIGIPPAETRAIFQEFHQVGNEARNRKEGLGLGLAIVDRLARLLGHTVGVRSQPGRGSVFAVEVPLARPAPAAAAPDRPSRRAAAGGGAAVLIIDDEPDIQDALRLQLENWGYRVDTASSGEEAVAVLARGFRPDFVLADYRLRRGETGPAAIQAVRQALGAEVPAMLFTGDTAPERLREAQRSGFDLMHKPVHPSKLREVLAQRLGRKNAKAAGGRISPGE